MFLTALSSYLKPTRRLPSWRDNKARSLPEAARLAHRLADSEDLPIWKTLMLQHVTEDIDIWFAKSMLNVIPVYGTRAGRRERIEGPARRGLHLMDGAQNLVPDAPAQPVWQDLQVQREDFNRYVDWLRSVW
ncbi:MAG: hypothetical protein KGI68_03940 [Alphaproteobacteria bacterium]|nr:hypothetical protein [Alphaproteobacteria bacterium]MDE1987689.1 hypothetical protein [Alphaproteobacteria bacterium]MDE2264845.1 hypothetical protein [Alphaproteobacteria bacterium]MDE2500444.1 hypothetical protein [Alphaproteobacteria bacterium]